MKHSEDLARWTKSTYYSQKVCPLAFLSFNIIRGDVASWKSKAGLSRAAKARGLYRRRIHLIERRMLANPVLWIQSWMLRLRIVQKWPGHLPFECLVICIIFDWIITCLSKAPKTQKRSALLTEEKFPIAPKSQKCSALLVKRSSHSVISLFWTFTLL